jgi:hypothetical protein
MSATPFRGRTDLIGGFNPLSWSSSGFYQNTPTGAPRNAFIFDLSTNDLRPQSNVQIGAVQTRNLGLAGPIFGAGNDLAVEPFLTLGSVDPESYGVSCNSHMGFSCEDQPNFCEGQPNFFGGINQTLFLIGGLEVFTISEIAAVPEMSTWAMIILGFARLGVIACRKGPFCARQCARERGYQRRNIGLLWFPLKMHRQTLVRYGPTRLHRLPWLEILAERNVFPVYPI